MGLTSKTHTAINPISRSSGFSLSIQGPQQEVLLLVTTACLILVSQGLYFLPTKSRLSCVSPSVSILWPQLYFPNFPSRLKLYLWLPDCCSLSVPMLKNTVVFSDNDTPRKLNTDGLQLTMVWPNSFSILPLCKSNKHSVETIIWIWIWIFSQANHMQ